MKVLLIVFLCFSYSFGAFAQGTSTDWRKELGMAKDDTTRLKCYVEIGLLLLPSNLDSSLFYLQKGEKLAQLFPNHYETMRLYKVFGSNYLKKRDFIKADDFLRKSQKIASDQHNEAYLMKTTFNRIIVLQFTGKYDEAIKGYLTFEKSLDRTKPENSTIFNSLYMNLSNCYFSLNNMDKALFYLRKMEGFLNNRVDSLNYYQQLIVMLDQKHENSEEAHIAYQNGIKLAKKSHDSNAEAGLTSNMGIYYKHHNQLQEALKYFSSAQKIAQKCGAEASEMIALANLGELSEQAGRHQEALNYYKKPIAYYKRTNNRENLRLALQITSKSYQAIGDYKKAFESSEEASKIYEETIGNNKQKIVAEIEAKYELSDKQKELIAKDLQNKLQIQTIKNNQLRTNFLLFLLLITVVLLFWIWRNGYKIKKNNQELALQKSIIEKQAVELQATNLSKDKLFAVISHDLRSPISKLVSSLFFWKDDDFRVHSENNSRLFLNVMNELENVQLVLNNLLQWSSLQLKNTEPTKKKLSINALVESCIDEFNTNIVEKNIQIFKNISHECIWADENQMQIILRNLLSNAIKFTQKDGGIMFSVKTKSDKISLSIKDTGIGIEPKQLEKIFEYPTPQKGTEGEIGTGIGLSLSKELCKKNNINLSIKSTVNVGTEIWLEAKSVS